MSVHPNPEVQFGDAMRNAGIPIDDPIHADGQIHRFHIVGEHKKTKRNGWYVLHAGNLPYGIFGNWGTGEEHHWQVTSNKQLNGDELRAHQLQVAEAKRVRDAEAAKLKAEVQIKANRLWASGGMVNALHPYLTKKGIKPIGIKQLRQSLVIPLRDTEGVIHTLQFIAEDGTKRFLTGGRKQGCFCLIGDIADSDVLCIAEGYATAASIYEATQCAVAVAFDAGNLLHVAYELRAKYPTMPITVCADDDFATDNNKNEGI